MKCRLGNVGDVQVSSFSQANPPGKYIYRVVFRVYINIRIETLFDQKATGSGIVFLYCIICQQYVLLFSLGGPLYTEEGNQFIESYAIHSLHISQNRTVELCSSKPCKSESLPSRKNRYV